MFSHRPSGSPKNGGKPLLPVIEEESEEAAVTRIVLLKRTFLPIDANARTDQDFFAKIERKRNERKKFGKEDQPQTTECNDSLSSPVSTAATDASAGRQFVDIVHVPNPLPRRLRPKSESPGARDLIELKKLTIHAKGEGYHKKLTSINASVKAWCSHRLSKTSPKCTGFDILDFMRCLREALDITYTDDAIGIRDLVYQDRSVHLSEEQLNEYLQPVIQWEALFGASGIARRCIPKRPLTHLELLVEVSLSEFRPVSKKMLSNAYDVVAKCHNKSESEEPGSVMKVNIEDHFRQRKTFKRTDWLTHYYEVKGIPCTRHTETNSDTDGSTMRHENLLLNKKSVLNQQTRQRGAEDSLNVTSFWKDNARSVAGDMSHLTLPGLAWMRVISFIRIDWLRCPGAFEDVNLCKEYLMAAQGSCPSKQHFLEWIIIVKHFLSFRRKVDRNKNPVAGLPETRVRLEDLADLVNQWIVTLRQDSEYSYLLKNSVEDEKLLNDEDDTRTYTPVLLQELSRRIDIKKKTLRLSDWVGAVYMLKSQGDD